MAYWNSIPKPGVKVNHGPWFGVIIVGEVGLGCDEIVTGGGQRCWGRQILPRRCLGGVGHFFRAQAKEQRPVRKYLLSFLGMHIATWKLELGRLIPSQRNP